MVNIEGIGNLIFACYLNKERMVYSEKCKKAGSFEWIMIIYPKVLYCTYYQHLKTLFQVHVLAKSDNSPLR